VTLVVTNSDLLLGLTTAILVGYAAAVSPQIAKVREQQSATGHPPTGESGTGGPGPEPR
jgi:hypothetical protein